MFCRYCGNEIKDTAKFCSKCGNARIIESAIGNKKEVAEERMVIKGKKKKTGLIVGGVIVVLLLISAIGILLYMDSNETGEKNEDSEFQSSEIESQKEDTQISTSEDIKESVDTELETLTESEDIYQTEEPDYSELVGVNLLLNSGFESSDFSMWNCMNSGVYRRQLDYETEAPFGVVSWPEDCYSGSYTFHFWNEAANFFEISQAIPANKIVAGKYTASVQVQGDEVGEDAIIYMYVKVNGEIYETTYVTLEGYQVWQMPTISDIELKAGDTAIIGVYVQHAAGGWGTIDDFEFKLQ